MSYTIGILFILFVFFASLDQYVGFEVLHQPLVTAFVLGLLFNQLETALKVGAMVQVITLSSLAIGGVQPPNRFMFGLSAVLLALFAFPNTYKLAIVFAYPIAHLGKAWVRLAFKLNTQNYQRVEHALRSQSAHNIDFEHIKAGFRLGIGFVGLSSLVLILSYMFEKIPMSMITGLYPAFEKSADLMVILALVMVYRQLEEPKTWLMMLSSLTILAVFSLVLNPIVVIVLLMIITFLSYLFRKKESVPIEEGI